MTKLSMIHGWLVSYSNLLTNLFQQKYCNVAICYKAIRNMVMICIVTSLMHRLIVNCTYVVENKICTLGEEDIES